MFILTHRLILETLKKMRIWNSKRNNLYIEFVTIGRHKIFISLKQRQFNFQRFLFMKKTFINQIHWNSRLAFRRYIKLTELPNCKLRSSLLACELEALRSSDVKVVVLLCPFEVNSKFKERS